jgi:hypothetical protein
VFSTRASHEGVAGFGGMISLVSNTFSCRHFSLANPRSDRPDDLPHLLRRLADEIDRLEIAPMDLLDVTIHDEMTSDGRWWSATVYWSPDDKNSSGA